jgi:hypothetical protein
MTTQIEKCERDLNNLEEMRESIASRAALLDRQRKSIAFAALTAGDPKSKAKLADINAEDAGLVANIASVEAALTVARANLATAKQAELSAADHEKAAQIAELNVKLKEQLDDADAAFADAIESVLSARALLQEMHGLGVGSPTDQLFRINCVVCIKTAIQKLPEIFVRDLLETRLAPSQKKQFRDLASGWFTQIANQIAARLGSSPKGKEAA